jgi:phage terminase large subunit-like protein
MKAPSRVDELCAFKNLQQTWDQLQFCLRLGKRPRIVVTTTPKPNAVLRALLKRDDVVVTRGRTADNEKNLAPSFLREIVGRYSGTRLGRQELDAEILDDTPGALWSRDALDASRVPASAAEWDYKRIVVAIDPAVTVGEDSDETGIIVAGIDWRDESFVLEDLSGRYQPHQWATKAIAALKRWQGDRIVAEVNQGGAMVENTLRAIDPSVPYRAVHASRGKAVRAEPISALWEQGRAHIVGTMPELEDQMASFAPGQSNGSSPDRMDAMVWALTDLVIAPQRPQFVFG